MLEKDKDICQELNNSKSKPRQAAISYLILIITIDCPIRDGLDSGGWNTARGRSNIEWSWTNFHCALCLGVGGFLLFWIFLLAR